MKNGPRNIAVKDETGAVADIAIYDVLQSNGVIHSIDRVLLPKFRGRRWCSYGCASVLPTHRAQ